VISARVCTRCVPTKINSGCEPVPVMRSRGFAGVATRTQRDCSGAVGARRSLCHRAVEASAHADDRKVCVDLMPVACDGAAGVSRSWIDGCDLPSQERSV
jgi:hypothetical protein